jgi:hypothetical protein
LNKQIIKNYKNNSNETDNILCAKNRLRFKHEIRKVLMEKSFIKSIRSNVYKIGFKIYEEKPEFNIIMQYMLKNKIYFEKKFNCLVINYNDIGIDQTVKLVDYIESL